MHTDAGLLPKSTGTTASHPSPVLAILSNHVREVPDVPALPHLPCRCVCLDGECGRCRPAGKSRNYDHTVQTTDPLGRFFGGSVSPVGRTTVSYPGNHRPAPSSSTRGNGASISCSATVRRCATGIGVGRDGMTWAGTTRVSAKREWPGWTRPSRCGGGSRTAAPHAGGPDNPLGARALLSRIVALPDPRLERAETIGRRCRRVLPANNEDVIDLYNRVPVGATV